MFAWNFGTINTSAKDVLAMLPRIQQFEASGVKVVLHDEIKLKASLAGMVDTELSEQERGATIDAVQKLTGSQVIAFSPSSTGNRIAITLSLPRR